MVSTPWRPADDPLVGLTDDARVEAAIAARSRERLHRQQATETATVVGTLVDLAERRGGIAVTTTSNRTFHGTIVGVATDHVALRTGAQAQVLVRLDAIGSVRPEPMLDAGQAAGERPAAHDRQLLEQCAWWVADRPMVAVALSGGADVLRGQLVAVGDDVLTVLPDGSRQPTYVAEHAVEAIAVDH